MAQLPDTREQHKREQDRDFDDLEIPVKRMKLSDTEDIGVEEEITTGDPTIEEKPSADLDDEFCPKNILESIEDVTNWKDLGVQLRLKSSRLSQIEGSGLEKEKMIITWMKYDPGASWKKLEEALETPTMCENRAAKGIAERRGSSIDKSSVISLQTEGSIDTDCEFNEANVRNTIVNIKNVRELGECLKIPPSRLDEIDKLSPKYQKQRLVEELFKVDPECDWTHLSDAIKEIKRHKSQSNSFSEDLFSNGTSNTGGISDIQTEDLLAPAAAKKKNRSMIKASHSKLIMDIAKNLNPDDMEEFHELVVELFEAGTIPEADNVKSIFRSLTKMKCWDFLDISNLESIVERFSDDERIDDNMIKIRNYQKNLAGFKAATKITDYIQSSKENDCDSPTEEYISIHEERDKYTERYRSKLSIQLLGDDKAHIKISLQSLEYVEKLWNSLCYQFNMPSLSKVLDSIVEGSIIIHWVVCHTHVQKILDGIRDAVDFFECQFISSVLVEDVCIYDCDDEGVADTKLLNYVKLLTVRQERKMDLTYSSIKEYFPDVNAPIKQDGKTPLMFAAQHGHMILLEPLLDSGADMYRYDRSGETILSLSRPHKKVHEWLNHKLEDKLITAAKDGDYSAVKQSLEFAIDPNATEIDEYKWSALLWACEKGHIEIVDYLLEQGADPNIQDKSNWTGLILASRNGYLDIVRKLLDKKADVNMMTKGLWTGLMWTAQEGHTEVARLLLERGADPKIKDEAGYTPLIQASQDGHLDIVELLVEHCSEINIDEQRINDGWSSLMVATKEGHVNIVRYLVDHGADVDFQKEDEVAALHIASYKGFDRIVRYMCITKKAKVNLQEKDGLTPLMYAVMGGNLAVTRTLFENGHAAVNIAENDNKWTAIFFAVEGKHQEIVEYLLRSGRVDVTQKDTRGQTVVDLAKELNPKAMEYLLKHHKKDTESILEEKRLGISKPINMKSYEPMLDHYKSKVGQLEEAAAAA